MRPAESLPVGRDAKHHAAPNRLDRRSLLRGAATVGMIMLATGALGGLTALPVGAVSAPHLL
jgi:hypothetical protein